MRRLSHQLLVWFVLIALVPFAVMAYLAYAGAERALRAEVTNGLFAIARRQVDAIGAVVRSHERNVTAVARMPAAAYALTALERALREAGSESAAYADIDRQVRPFLTSYVEEFNYVDLALVSSAGDVVFSVRQGKEFSTNLRDGPYRATGLAQAFERANTLLVTEFSDYAVYPATGEIAAFAAAPVLQENRSVGVVALHLNNEELYRVIHDFTGLGETGETLLNRSNGDHVIFITPPRHDPDAAFRMKVPFDASQGPSQRSARGYRGEGIALDYRGEPVLAVWRYVPALGGGLVVKIDTSEAFRPIARLKTLTFGLAGATLIVVALAALFVAGAIAGPVVKLTAATERIADGDLSRQVDVEASNEIGRLAGSFNRMAGRLGESIERLKTTTAAKERIDSELRVAHEIQMGILPKIFPPFPERPEFDLHALIHPAQEVGGDFYDFFLIGDDELYFVIGDVAGKGVPASLFMAVTITLFRSSLVWGLNPAALLSKLNEHLCADDHESLFVTIFCGKLHVTSGEVLYSNGGHNAPYLLRSSGSLEQVRRVGGPALGLSDAAKYQLGRVTLQQQDTLVLFTDGVTEATGPDDQFFLESRLEACLRAAPVDTARQLVESVSGAVDAFTAGARQADDITLVALRYCGSTGRSGEAGDEEP
jgi:sigma-B regulation protein RsbU (phosphoserine phosphatase)